MYILNTRIQKILMNVASDLSMEAKTLFSNHISLYGAWSTEQSS